jgi:Uma2 family endonuclease
MVAPQRQSSRMSVELFRSFVEGRPDEEHWELIDGVAMMMAPPTLAHLIIAGNLQGLLNEAFESHALAMIAIQGAGVNVAPEVEDYDPEPDVVVIDTAVGETAGERYAPRFHLAAEIVSASDRVEVVGKREVYKLHDSCTCILTIQQDRFEVRVDLRRDAGWTDSTLTMSNDLLVLSDFGLHCKLKDLYRGTPLAPRGTDRG